ncbi:MAG: hypothetical protein AB1485_09430 [Candidatus Thermoplasmatota archaeon]
MTGEKEKRIRGCFATPLKYEDCIAITNTNCVATNVFKPITK